MKNTYLIFLEDVVQRNGACTKIEISPEIIEAQRFDKNPSFHPTWQQFERANARLLSKSFVEVVEEVPAVIFKIFDRQEQRLDLDIVRKPVGDYLASDILVGEPQNCFNNCNLGKMINESRFCDQS